MEETNEILDDAGNVIGTATRKEVLKGNLRHRSVGMIVANSKGEFFVAQRAASKRVYPLKWMAGAGGGVKLGESYDEAARRELMEELGFVADLKYLSDFKYDSPVNRYHAKLYIVVYDGEIQLDKREFSQGRWVSREELLEMLARGDMCPDTEIFVGKYLGQP